MPADTPAPSALDALLREVDGLAPWQDATGAPFVPLAPRLAAIVRVLRDVVVFYDGHDDGGLKANKALARAEAIAKGE